MIIFSKLVARLKHKAPEKKIVVTAISRFKYPSFSLRLPFRSSLINEVLLTRWKQRVAKNRDLTPGDYRSPFGHHPASRIPRELSINYI